MLVCSFSRVSGARCARACGMARASQRTWRARLQEWWRFLSSSRGMARQWRSEDVAASWPIVACIRVLLSSSYISNRVQKKLRRLSSTKTSCVSTVFVCVLSCVPGCSSHLPRLRRRAPARERLHPRRRRHRCHTEQASARATNSWLLLCCTSSPATPSHYSATGGSRGCV